MHVTKAIFVWSGYKSPFLNYYVSHTYISCAHPIQTASQSYDDAAATCQSWSMNLAIYETQAEYDAIASILGENFLAVSWYSQARIIRTGQEMEKNSRYASFPIKQSSCM